MIHIYSDKDQSDIHERFLAHLIMFDPLRNYTYTHSLPLHAYIATIGDGATEAFFNN